MSKTNDNWTPSVEQTKKFKQFLNESKEFYNGIRHDYPESAVKIVFDVGYVIIDKGYIAWCKTDKKSPIQHAIQVEPKNSWDGKLLNQTMLSFINEYIAITSTDVIDIKIDKLGSMVHGLRTASVKPMTKAVDLLKKIRDKH